MVRRLLIILTLIGIFSVLSALNRKRLQKRFPFLKRLDATLTIAAWVWLAAYVGAFLYWLFTKVLRK